MKKSWLLFIVSIFFVFAQSITITAQTDKQLHLAMQENPNSLDPGIAADNYSGAILMNTMEGLTRLDLDGNPQPAIAKSWDVSEDGLTYTFHLRDAEWSNGQQVTSQDFYDGWMRILSKEVASQSVDQYFIIENAKEFYEDQVDAAELGIEVIDDTTFKVTLAYPSPYFLELIANYYFSPIHDQNPELSNGPFVIENYQNDVEIQLIKNDHYWDKAAVDLDNVNIRIINSESTIANEFLAGNLDFIGMPFGTISFDNKPLFTDTGELKTTTPATVYNFRINTTDDHLSNVHLRQALSMAIDREELVNQITKGNEVPANGLIPPVIDGFESTPLFDVEIANQHLAEALNELQLDDRQALHITIDTNGNEDHATIAQYIQSQWQQHLNLKVKINLSEWNLHYENLQNLNFQLGRIANPALYKDATSFLNPFVEKDNVYNMTGWHNEQYVELIDEAQQETDLDKRLVLLQEAHQQLMDEAPFIPLYHYGRDYVVAEEFQQLQPGPIGGVNLKYVKIK